MLRKQLDASKRWYERKMGRKVGSDETRSEYEQVAQMLGDSKEALKGNRYFDMLDSMFTSLATIPSDPNPPAAAPA